MSNISGAPAPAEERQSALATWQRRNTFAQWVSALAACVALAGIFLQLKSSTNSSRESSARQLYGNYMEAGLRYPEFLAPEYQRIKADAKQLVQ